MFQLSCERRALATELGPPPDLIVINRLGITGRYPHNLEMVLEQYTKGQTQKLVNETQEILTWSI